MTPTRRCASRAASARPVRQATPPRKRSREPRQEMFNRESFFVTHYDDVVATLLDDRFSSIRAPG